MGAIRPGSGGGGGASALGDLTDIGTMGEPIAQADNLTEVVTAMGGAAAVRSAIGAGTSSVASTDITDATATGRALVTAANAAAARSAIGAGTAVVAPSVTASNGDDGHGRWFFRARVLRSGSPVVGAYVALRGSVSTATALATATGYNGTQIAQLPASGAYAATAWTWWGTTDADGYFGVALTPPSSVTVAVVGECEGVASTLTSHTFA